MTQFSYGIPGLTDAEVAESRAKNGQNTTPENAAKKLWHNVKDIVLEPMFLLLLAASCLYFIMGEVGNAIFMATSILLVTAISIFQENKSKKAVEALRKLTAPHCKVIRNGEVTEIATSDLVLADVMLVEEGVAIPADGDILQSWDFQVNESILTGEAMAVSKNADSPDKVVFQGSTVAGGSALCRVTAIGANTRLGKIGNSIDEMAEEPSPLLLQINQFVKQMVLIGAVVFVAVWIIQFSLGRGIVESLMKALTLAMSLVPEEIPVTFSTFMALGAWRLLKMGIIVKQTRTVETLGSATVICTDKTGTITENRMTLSGIYVPGTGLSNFPPTEKSVGAEKLLAFGMWSSELVPFDPMEIAIHQSYTQFTEKDVRPEWQMVHEYSLSGRPPMMTHVFAGPNGARLIAAKGAPEAIIALSNLSDSEKKEIDSAFKTLTAKGYRVLAVGESGFQGTNFPANQQDLPFTFLGLLAFYDPPKKGMAQVFNGFYQAGIKLKVITGDNAATTSTIARQTKLQGSEFCLEGPELVELDDATLSNRAEQNTLFCRMFPEAKLRIINALKAKGEVIAMLGDGVNDGPALKAAHIGIAMGNKGTEIAKQAASLVLIDDDLGKLQDAIAMGRRIYVNLKKAIRYIISIHVPIVLMVLVPLALNWKYPNIFTPVHVIFLELIMGPTCSIVYENEPMEANTMLQPPRPLTSTFFNFNELITSIIQGLVITAGLIVAYFYAIQQGLSENETRAMVYLALISANVWLTLVNRSFYYSVIRTLGYKNNLILVVLGLTIATTVLIMEVPFLNHLFSFGSLNRLQTGISVGLGSVSVLWYEGVKGYHRMRGEVR